MKKWRTQVVHGFDGILGDTTMDEVQVVAAILTLALHSGGRSKN